MWRLFRTALKCSTGSGSQTSVRIFGTNYEDLDTEDSADPDTFGTLVENNKGTKLNHAAAAAKKYQFGDIASSQYKKDNLIGNNINRYKIKEYNVPNYMKNPVENLGQDKLSEHLLLGDIGQVVNRAKSKHQSKNKETRNQIRRKNVNPEKMHITISPDGTLQEMSSKENDFFDENIGRRLSDHGYGRKILQLCREKKLKKALDIVETEMVEMKVLPSLYSYNILINACGKAGYTYKAFKLFKQMKRDGHEVEKFALTGLFNACANSPWPNEDGLHRASNLRKQLAEKGTVLTNITYHAMIKAFGRAGDIETAFEIADEMFNKRIRLTSETFNFLLQACVTDKKNGFRHALMVWKKMRGMKISPDIYSYNLLLRCIKECKAGEQKIWDQILERPKTFSDYSKGKNSEISKPMEINEMCMKPDQPLPESETHQHPSDGVKPDKPLFEYETCQHPSDGVKPDKPLSEYETCQHPSDGVKPDQPLFESEMHQHPSDESSSTSVSILEVLPEYTTKQEVTFPDVLSKSSDVGKVIGISSLDLPEHRLTFVGGMLGILKNMHEDKVKPNAASFTFILEAMPGTLEGEEKLMEVMESAGVKLDVIFCNLLIRKRALRRDFENAKEVLEIMHSNTIYVDLVTFGCLAIACREPSQGKMLLQDLRASGFRLNVEILNALLWHAVRSNEYLYMLELLHHGESCDVLPNEKILLQLENARKAVRNAIISKERSGDSRRSRKDDERRLFLLEYKSWLKRNLTSFDDHPWTQYGYRPKIEASKNENTILAKAFESLR